MTQKAGGVSPVGLLLVREDRVASVRRLRMTLDQDLRDATIAVPPGLRMQGPAAMAPDVSSGNCRADRAT